MTPRAKPKRAATRTSVPFKPESPEVAALMAANSADRRLRERIRYELQGMYASWGMGKSALADLLQSEAESLRHDVELANLDARSKR